VNLRRKLKSLSSEERHRARHSLLYDASANRMKGTRDQIRNLKAFHSPGLEGAFCEWNVNIEWDIVGIKFPSLSLPGSWIA
jgi:hypothetical protein